MKSVRLLTIFVATFGLLIAGCSSQSKSTKDDDTKTQQQKQTEEKKKDKKKGKKGKKKKGKEHPGDEHPGDKKGKKGKEHPGDEHPGDKKGKEHPGDEKGKEHPGDKEEDDDDDEESDDSAMNFGADDIKTAMRNHIQSESENGVFTIEDEKEGETLKLEFVKIHDPVREMTEKGSYFGCTDFHVKGNKDKVYDLDFWLKPKGDSLEVVRSKVHKHPVKKDGKWVKEARYTFKNNEIAKIE